MQRGAAAAAGCSAGEHGVEERQVAAGPRQRPIRPVDAVERHDMHLGAAVGRRQHGDRHAGAVDHLGRLRRRHHHRRRREAVDAAGDDERRPGRQVQVDLAVGELGVEGEPVDGEAAARSEDHKAVVDEAQRDPAGVARFQAVADRQGVAGRGDLARAVGANDGHRPFGEDDRPGRCMGQCGSERGGPCGRCGRRGERRVGAGGAAVGRWRGGVRRSGVAGRHGGWLRRPIPAGAVSGVDRARAPSSQTSNLSLPKYYPNGYNQCIRLPHVG